MVCGMIKKATREVAVIIKPLPIIVFENGCNVKMSFHTIPPFLHAKSENAPLNNFELFILV